MVLLLFSRLFKSEGVTPEINDVYEFVTSILGADCPGEKELTFLTLRVGHKHAAEQKTFVVIFLSLLFLIHS